LRILVIEDETLAYLIRRGLTEDGYAVDIVMTEMKGQYFAEDIQYDLIFLISFYQKGWFRGLSGVTSGKSEHANTHAYLQGQY